MLTVVIPWRRQTLEDKTKFIPLVMFVPLILLGIVIFTSLSFEADDCTDWFVFHFHLNCVKSQSYSYIVEIQFALIPTLVTNVSLAAVLIMLVIQPLLQVPPYLQLIAYHTKVMKLMLI